MAKNSVSVGVIGKQRDSAQEYLDQADVNIPEEAIQSEGLKQIDILKYEFRKYLLHCILEGRKTVIGIDGYDSGGKTKTSRSITSEEDVYGDGIIKRVSLPKPNKRQNDMPIIRRYEDFFPGKGKTVVFDRTWNNRSFVQMLNGYCTPEQYEEFIDTLPQELARLQEEGYDISNFFLHIKQELQAKRLEARSKSYRHDFRYSESDQRAVENHSALEEEVRKLSEIYEAAGIPLTIISGEKKKKIPTELLREFLREKDYPKKSTTVDFSRNTKLVSASINDIIQVERTKNT